MGNTSSQDSGGGKRSKKPRTAAQIAAARRNGSKSKGPVSEEGKQNSRRNAFKHGLTAKFLKPPSDARSQDQLYEHLYRELMHEYEPRGFTAESTVSNLAHDYVQMIRCRQMIEALQKPARLPTKEQEAWDTMQQTKRDLQAISEAIDCLSTKEDLNFLSQQARILGQKVANYTIGLEADIQEIEKQRLQEEAEGTPSESLCDDNLTTDASEDSAWPLRSVP